MFKVVVFGLGRFGAAVASRLFEEGAEVLAIDARLEVVEQYRDQVSAGVAFDATIKGNLEAYDVGHMDVAVIAIGDFQASVLATVYCLELGVPLVVAKALSHQQRRVLKAVGAHRVVQPEEDVGFRLAEHLLHESVVDFVELPQGFSLRRIEIPASWVGRTLSDLRLLTAEGLNLIQIVRSAPAHPAMGEEAPEATAATELIPLPHGGTRLLAGDRLDVIGADETLERFRRHD